MENNYHNMTLSNFLNAISYKSDKCNDGSFDFHESAFSKIEIYNYLEKTTGCFMPQKTKLTLDVVEFYYEYIFLERIKKESINYYKRKNFDIPRIPSGVININVVNLNEFIENNPNGPSANEIMMEYKEWTVENGKIINLPPQYDSFIEVEYDFEAMRKISHEDDICVLHMTYAIGLLKDRLNEPKESNFEPNEKNQTETIVALYELGILDYLKDKFNLSVSYAQFANVLRTFTDLSQNNAKRSLSALYSFDKSNKNNPLKTKNINKIHGELKQINIDTDKLKTPFSQLGEK